MPGLRLKFDQDSQLRPPDPPFRKAPIVAALASQGASQLPTGSFLASGVGALIEDDVVWDVAEEQPLAAT
jgi:hypothetical protein